MHNFRLAIVFCLLLTIAATSAQCDENQARYFEQLRQRRLFGLAESEAISRLTSDELPLAARTDFSIELSRTLTEHAGFVSDEQQNELWQRARTTIQDLLDRERSNPRSILLSGQLGFVFAAEGDWLRAEREVRPFDELLLNKARTACSKAIDQLKLVEKVLGEPSRDPLLKKSESGTPLAFELRTLLHQVRWQQGQSYRNRAELSVLNSAERDRDLADAEISLRRLVGVADEPIQSRAKLQLVACLRLKNENQRASDMLTAIEKADPKSIESVQDEATVERVRWQLEMKRPTDAAELLLKTRASRQRLTGELWLLQTRALIALRAMTIEKKQETLAERLAEQVATTIDRCDEQVGGFWGRRCRQLWENAQTVEKYGVELDSLMQQARGDFIAGRIDAALAEYGTAEKTAVARGQPELAMELGFTRASILLDETQFEAASVDFLRLATEYPNQARAAKAHLLATYCLGRLYDEKKTQSRRETYTESLDRHINNFPRDETVNDARYLKAQLDEQRLQATRALPLYLQVAEEHPRRLEAVAGAARCYETILRRMVEKHLPSQDLDREAVECLSDFLSKANETSDKWNATHSEIALRLAAILLLGFENAAGSNGSTRCQQAERWLARVSTYIASQDADAVANASIERIRQRMAPLRVIALVGNGNFVEAEKVLQSLSASPAEMLTVLERFTGFVVAAQGNQRFQIASLQLRAAEQLAPLRDRMSPAESERLDRSLVSAFLSSGQVPKAVAIARTLAERSAKDIDRQREMAILLAEVNHSDSQGLAKQCWRRVESLSKAGSPEWFAARLGVLKACVRLNQIDEGRKLLQVTKVVYPELGGDAVKRKFDAIEKDLLAGKTAVK